ncbi:MAG: 30S ribosomal protein S3 [Caldilineaceae bacterium]|nr:30S ribosomal protein S3 [Caldilineaceae bacterium]
MGRKVHPIGFRLGIIKDHKSRWFATGKKYTEQLAEDREIRKTVQVDLPKAGISNIEIERQPNQVHVIIDTARPGVIIGRKGASVNVLRSKLQDMTQKKVKIDVREITKPELDSYLVAESIAEQLERRISWKRAMKQAVQKTMKAGAKGVMITVAGRLGGSDMGRVDTVRDGQIPRHTLRADIDYGTAEANTTFGVIGIKVWIYLGEILPGEEYHAHLTVEPQ